MSSAWLPVAWQNVHNCRAARWYYMMAARDSRLADAISRATADFNPGLLLYTLPDSALAKAAVAHGLRVVGEYFADRPYQDTEVTMFGWTLEQLGTPADAADRVSAMLADPRFADVGTVCVHSDTPEAPSILRAVQQRLQATGRLSGPCPD